MQTRIYRSMAEWLERDAKYGFNGVSEEFARQNPDWYKMNETNQSCWNCYGCIACHKCYDCSFCGYMVNCRMCMNCSDSTNCFKCNNCRICDWCTECWDCENLTNSENKSREIGKLLVVLEEEKISEEFNLTIRFNNKEEFLKYIEETGNKKINGVSEEFAIQHPSYMHDNWSNKNCWNCSNTSFSTNCFDCNDCYESTNLIRCSNVSQSSECEQCIQCKRLRYCKDCSMCEDLIHSEKVFNIKIPSGGLYNVNWKYCALTY